uniref:DDE Tnp4 domain-containing protein n=2 Tax=Vitis vinifera TaxID=29760 RepID=F6HN91_VITVI
MAKPANFSASNGNPLSLNDRVAIALRRLSSGESFSIVGDSFGVNQSTVAQITWKFVESMEVRGLHHLQWPSTEADMEETKSSFEKIRGLPNCCGAVDTTHISMSLSTMGTSNKVWIDHQKKHSMILQAIVDPEMRFRDVITGWPGSLSESCVLQNSGFFKLSEEGKRLNGKMIELSEGTYLREYIVGDAGFPLLPWLLTPYQGKGLSDFQSEFNKRHFATRMVARRALARLKEMWRIIQGVMWRPDTNKLPRIILVCCLLHNIVIDLEDGVQDEMPFSYKHDPGYRQRSCESVDKTAFIQRENLSLYFPIQASKRYSTVIGTILRPLGLGFWKMEVKKIIKDKKFWVASFLVAWAAALQGHMMWLQRQDAFKQKFGDLGQDHDPEN